MLLVSYDEQSDELSNLDTEETLTEGNLTEGGREFVTLTTFQCQDD